MEPVEGWPRVVTGLMLSWSPTTDQEFSVAIEFGERVVGEGKWPTMKVTDGPSSDQEEPP